MAAAVRSRTFTSGNSVALRLPKTLGLGPGEVMDITRHGDVLTLRRVPSLAEEAVRLAEFRAMLLELQALGPVGEVQEREPIEFPDRPSLY